MIFKYTIIHYQLSTIKCIIPPVTIAWKNGCQIVDEEYIKNEYMDMIFKHNTKRWDVN